MLTQERLKELLDYDPDTGVFVWRVSRGGINKDTQAGSKLSNGYIYISISKRRYYTHRLAWLYVHGCWPTNQIDHINRVRDDNRICNLREATPSENQWNGGKYKNNTSGLLGVQCIKSSGKWKAQITIHGIVKNLGHFNTPEEANAAYVRAKAEHHKF